MKNEFKSKFSWAQVFMAVTLDTWDAEIRRIIIA
jgi:hypothetical protein